MDTEETKNPETFDHYAPRGLVQGLGNPNNPAAAELSEYLRLRDAAETYLSDHPLARKALMGLRELAPDKF